MRTLRWRSASTEPIVRGTAAEATRPAGTLHTAWGAAAAGQTFTKPPCHARGRQQARAAEDPRHPGMTERLASRLHERRGDPVLQPRDEAPHVVPAEPQVCQRGKEGHADLPRPVEDRAAPAAHEAALQPPLPQLLVRQEHVGPRAESPDGDGRFQFTDQQRRTAAPGLGDVPREPLGERCVGLQPDRACQPDGQRPPGFRVMTKGRLCTRRHAIRCTTAAARPTSRHGEQRAYRAAYSSSSDSIRAKTSAICSASGSSVTRK